jgi:hypothetical protein
MNSSTDPEAGHPKPSSSQGGHMRLGKLVKLQIFLGIGAVVAVILIVLKGTRKI